MNKNAIETQLLQMGIPASNKGFRYIVASMTFIESNAEYMNRTGELYKTIADNFADTPSRVERTIRHSVETSFINAPLKTLEEIFGSAYSAEKGKPTNSEFIAALYIYLSRDTLTAKPITSEHNLITEEKDLISKFTSIPNWKAIANAVIESWTAKSNEEDNN